MTGHKKSNKASVLSKVNHEVFWSVDNSTLGKIASVVYLVLRSSSTHSVIFPAEGMTEILCMALEMGGISTEVVTNHSSQDIVQNFVDAQLGALIVSDAFSGKLPIHASLVVMVGAPDNTELYKKRLLCCGARRDNSRVNCVIVMASEEALSLRVFLKDLKLQFQQRSVVSNILLDLRNKIDQFSFGSDLTDKDLSIASVNVINDKKNLKPGNLDKNSSKRASAKMSVNGNDDFFAEMDTPFPDLFTTKQEKRKRRRSRGRCRSAELKNGCTDNSIDDSDAEQRKKGRYARANKKEQNEFTTTEALTNVAAAKRFRNLLSYQERKQFQEKLRAE